MRRDSALTVVGCHSEAIQWINFILLMCPTLVSYDVFKKASEADLTPMRISEGTIGELSQKPKEEI